MQGAKAAQGAKRNWFGKHLGLILIILVQTAVYILAGVNKAYLHMDEAFSLGLTHFEQIDPASQADFYDHWHSGEYFEDYLAVDKAEVWDLGPVIRNQKNDVHPPLFYLLLRLSQNMVAGQYSKWPGIILNILIAVGNTVLIFAILNKLLQKEKQSKIKALVMTAVAALTIATVSAVVYIRMYQLLTFWVLLTTWLHLQLYEREKLSWKLLVAIGVTVVAGMLTQYYYLFFLAPLWLVLLVKYVRAKRWKELGCYTGTLLLAGGVSLAIWPVMLQHMFFGYRGQGVLENLFNPVILIEHLWDYVLLVDYNVFHHLLLPILLILIGLVVCHWRRNVKLEKTNGDFWLVLWPTLSYFVLAAVASPFIELRYIMPVCGLIFALVMYSLYHLCGKLLKEKMQALVALSVMSVVLLAAPMQIRLGWMRVELLYRDRQAVMDMVEQNPDVPILYFITTQNNRFLDNILPFAVAKESYLALDLLAPTVDEIREILQNRDLSAGLIVFVSSEQNQQEALNTVQVATGLQEIKWVQGINTCDVYYLR